MPPSSTIFGEETSPLNPYSDDADYEKPEYIAYTNDDVLTGPELAHFNEMYNEMVDLTHEGRLYSQRLASNLRDLEGKNTEDPDQIAALQRANNTLEGEVKRPRREKRALENEVSKLREDRSGGAPHTPRATAPTADGHRATSVSQGFPMGEDSARSDQFHAGEVESQRPSSNISPRDTDGHRATSVSQGFLRREDFTRSNTEDVESHHPSSNTSPRTPEVSGAAQGQWLTVPSNDSDEVDEIDEMEVDTADLTRSDDAQLSELDIYVRARLKPDGETQYWGRLVLCRGEYVPIDVDRDCRALESVLQHVLKDILKAANQEYAGKRKSAEKDESWSTFGKKTAGCVLRRLRMAKTRFGKGEDDRWVACYHCFNAQIPRIRRMGEKGDFLVPLPLKVRSDSPRDIGYYVYGRRMMQQRG